MANGTGGFVQAISTQLEMTLDLLKTPSVINFKARFWQFSPYLLAMIKHAGKIEFHDKLSLCSN